MPDQPSSGLASAVGEAKDRLAPLGCQVHELHEVGSTNDVAAQLAERGAPEGTLVVAAAQTAGRGRLGRQWHSPPEAGLYVSVLVRHQAAAPWLTLAGGVAVAEGVRAATGLPVEIKWPNDIVVEGGRGPRGRRKLAGVLAEASSGQGGVLYVVVGFGINLRPAAYPAELAERATSLETELGRPVDAVPLLIEVLAAFASAFGALVNGRPGAVLERWRALAPSASGARVECDTKDGRLAGITSGIAEDGALLVRTAAGLERIIAGEVIWR